MYVHDDIGHFTAFCTLNHNTVRVQQDSCVVRRTARRRLNNTGKDNMVYPVLILAVGTFVRVAGKVREDAAVLVKYFQNVLVIPNQTHAVRRAKIHWNVTYKCNRPTYKTNRCFQYL